MADEATSKLLRIIHLVCTSIRNQNLSSNLQKFVLDMKVEQFPYMFFYRGKGRRAPGKAGLALEQKITGSLFASTLFSKNFKRF